MNARQALECTECVEGSSLRRTAGVVSARFASGSPYRILPPENPEAVPRLIGDLIEERIDVVTFTSPPAVNNLFIAADELGRAEDLAAALNERLITASVGPAASAAIRGNGIEPALETESQRMGNLVWELAEVFSSGERPPQGS